MEDRTHTLLSSILYLLSSVLGPWVLPGRLGQAMAVGVDHQVEAVGDAEFVEDRRQMVADRRHADRQPLGDVLVVQSLADQPDYLALARSEPGNLGGLRIDWRLCWAALARDLGERPRHHRRLKPDFPGVDLLDRVDQRV